MPTERYVVVVENAQGQDELCIKREDHYWCVETACATLNSYADECEDFRREVKRLKDALLDEARFDKRAGETITKLELEEKRLKEALRHEAACAIRDHDALAKLKIDVAGFIDVNARLAKEAEDLNRLLSLRTYPMILVNTDLDVKPKDFDEVVVENVAHFHLEYMDKDCVLLKLSDDHGRLIAINLWRKGKTIRGRCQSWHLDSKRKNEGTNDGK